MKTLLKQHIMIRDGIGYLSDAPHLKAHLVAQMHLDAGQSIEQVAAHYNIEMAAVYAALAYYYDNQDELERVHISRIKRAQQSGKDHFESHAVDLSDLE